MGAKKTLWTEAEDKLLIEMELAYRPRVDIAVALGRPLRGIDGRLGHLRSQQKISHTRGRGGQVFLPPFPQSPNPVFDDFLEVDGEWAISTDYHCPTHNWEWCLHLIDVAKVLRVTNLAIASDFLNAEAYSYFDRLVPSAQTDWGTELEVAGRVVEALMRHFTRVILLPGNHEERFLRANQFECSFEHLIRLIGLPEGLRSRIQVNVGPRTRAAYRYALFSGFRVTHPKNYSIIPLRVAYELASRFEQHIICSHGHRCGVTMSKSGKYYVVDSGGMFDKTRTAYLRVYDKTFPEVTNGFVIIKDSPTGYKPHVFGEWSDWNFWSGLTAPAPKRRKVVRI